MSEPITIPPNTNALADLVVAEDGVWKLGGPRKVAGFTEFYFKADVQEWWVWDGSDDHKLLSGLLNGRVPAVVTQWPPVVTDDLVVGDWIFAGPLGGHAVGQIARFIGANRPDPFHYFKVYYEDDTDPGNTLRQPLLSARLTTDNTVRLQFPVLNQVESLSAIWVYRMINGGSEKLIVYPPGTTEIIDDDLEGIVDGDVLVYVRVDVSGTGSSQVQSPRSIPSVVIITGPDLGPLVFTITEATGRPANWKRITILNPTIAGPINYDWSIYKGDAYAGGEYVGNAYNVTSEGTFDIDLSPFPLTVSMTNLRFYLAQSVGVPPGRRQSWQPFTVSEDIQYLAPPTELVAAFVDGGYVQLYWKDNTPYETGYEIYRSTDGGGFARLNVAGVDATSYQDHNVDNIPGKKYRYRVVAVKGSLSSEPSNDADVWMDMETLPAPGWIRAYESNGEVLMELSLNYPGSISGITIDYDVAAHYPGGQLGDELSPWTLWARDMPITNTIKSPAAPWRTWYHRIRIKKDGYVSKWSTVMKVGYGENTNSPQMNWSTMGAIQTLTKGDVLLPARTAAYYLSGQYNPHSKFGSFRRVVRSFGIHLDTVGSWNNIPYNFIRDKQGFGWLGFTSSGPYRRSVETDDAYYEREDVPDRRFWTLHQNEIEGTTIPVLNNGFINPNPAPVGKTFTTDAGATYTVTADMQTAFRWDTRWWWTHRNLNGFPVNALFGRLRANMENHNIIYGTAPGYYDVLRNIAENGTGYASAANGGTDPYYKTLTDQQFQNDVLVQNQANINAWFASDASDKAPGIQTFIYGDGQSAFVQNGGVRLDQTFYKQTPFGRPVDLLGSGSYGWIDLLLMAVPFFIARTDKQGNDHQNIFADLCIADGWAATDTVVGGEPEFFRYSVSDAHPNGRVTVRFEDGNGNLCKTTKKYILENDYGGAGQKVEVPIGTTVIAYNNAARLPNWFFNSSIDDFVDDSLVNYFWHYALFLFATRKPLSHQVYPWLISLRHQGKPNENSFTAQLPRRLVHGMNFLSQLYQVNQIWYQLQMYPDINGGQNSVGVCRTMDALIESNYMIAELNMHFNRAEVTKVPEISMDGGQTWTSGTQCFRNTAYAPDHFKYVDGAYSAEWIRARRNAAQTSPLVLVSYSHFNRSWVIFEKAVFGPEITYSMRVKDKYGNYTYFNNRTVKKDWNRDIIYF